MTTYSVRQLAMKLGTDPRTVRGIAIGLKVRFDRTPAADLVAKRDADKIEAAFRRSLAAAS